MLFTRTQIMSREEYLKMRAIEKLELDNNITKLDRVIGKIKKNKELYKRLVVTIAIMLFVMNINMNTAFAMDVDEAVIMINSIVTKSLKLVRAIGSAANLVYAFKGVIEELLKGKSITKPVLNYVWVQFVLYFLPELGDLIASMVNE